MKLTYRQFWFRWIMYCGFGEMLSIAAAAVIVVSYNYAFGIPKDFSTGAVYFIVMLIAAAVQGTILSIMQWFVLRLKYSSIKIYEWWGYTISATLLFWAFGVIPAMFYSTTAKTEMYREVNAEPEILVDSLKQLPIIVPLEESIVQNQSLLWTIIPALLLGMLCGLIFGLFQWLSLRKHSSRAIAWIFANTFGWGLAMVWIFLAAILPDANTPIPLLVGMGAAGAIMAGLSISVITGWFLSWMPFSEQEYNELPKEELSKKTDEPSQENDVNL